MRWKRTLLIALPLAAVLAAGLLLDATRALPFRANHVQYLMNDHRYGAALEEYERLAAAHPREAQRLSAQFQADFRTVLLANAAGYYSQRFIKVSQGPAYLALLERVELRRELAPQARRRRLDFLALLDGKSTMTLAAARRILSAEGFESEALWWAAYNQYDPTRPLEIPPELLQYRKGLLAAQTARQAPPTAEEAARMQYLSALLALADRNWAEAAADLEQYRAWAAADREKNPQTHPELETLDLAQGVAYLKEGYPEEAIHHLRQYRQRHARDGGALRWLAGAYLALPKYPWASQTLGEIRALAPTQEALVFQDCFGIGGRDPLSQLCGALRRGGPYAGNAELWEWLAETARTDAQRRAVDAAAEGLIAGGLTQAADQAAVLQYCLRGERTELARRLIAAAGGVDATATLRRQSMERVLAWFQARTPAADGGTDSHALLTHAMTDTFSLNLPPGATLAVLMVVGYPADGIWPIVHVSLGELGTRTYYLGDSRAQARPLVLALRRPAGRPLTLEGSVSLVNGGEGAGEGRNVMIVEARAF